MITDNLNGFLVVNSSHADWELKKLGFGPEDLLPSLELAQQYLDSTIHLAYRDEYSIREVVNGEFR